MKTLKSQTYQRRTLLYFGASCLMFLVAKQVWALKNAEPTLGTIELHSHLFMDHAMRPLMRGNFWSSLPTKSVETIWNAQADLATLNKSNNQIVVISLYAHRLFDWDMRATIRKQIQEVQKLRQLDPSWVLAKSSQEARTALTQGHKILILSLEGASGILERTADLDEFITQDGIKIVTPLHLTDDEIGGVALLNGIHALASPWAFLWSPRRPLPRTNPRGLTVEGMNLIRSLIGRGVWIDLAHASDAATDDILTISKQPLLYTHTVLRQTPSFNVERGLRPEYLTAIRNKGGFIGLMPARDYLGGGIEAWTKQFESISNAIGEYGASSIGLGSDTNGGIIHLPTEKNFNGYITIDDTKNLWERARQLSVTVPPTTNASIEHFLNLWNTAESSASNP